MVNPIESVIPTPITEAIPRSNPHATSCQKQPAARMHATTQHATRHLRVGLTIEGISAARVFTAASPRLRRFSLLVSVDRQNIVRVRLAQYRLGSDQRIPRRRTPLALRRMAHRLVFRLSSRTRSSVRDPRRRCALWDFLGARSTGATPTAYTTRRDGQHINIRRNERKLIATGSGSISIQTAQRRTTGSGPALHRNHRRTPRRHISLFTATLSITAPHTTSGIQHGRGGHHTRDPATVPRLPRHRESAPARRR